MNQSIKDKMFEDLVESELFPIDVEWSLHHPYFDLLMDHNYLNEIHALKWIIHKKRIPECQLKVYTVTHGETYGRYYWHESKSRWNHLIEPLSILPKVFFGKYTIAGISFNKSMVDAYRWIIDKYRTMDDEDKIECWKWIPNI